MQLLSGRANAVVSETEAGNSLSVMILRFGAEEILVEAERFQFLSRLIEPSQVRASPVPVKAGMLVVF